MATYKVWLTVKDEYGNTKEVDGGNIDVNLDDLNQEDINSIEKALPLEDYIKRESLSIELDSYATDKEVKEAIQKKDTIKYRGFFDEQEPDKEGGN